MRLYDVFDCSTTIGTACTVPSRPLAHLVAWFLSLRTGRFHDYWANGYPPLM